jgi:hypothetical protein
VDDNLLQAYARLTAHEFLLEVLYANWFASLAEPNARQLSTDIKKRMQTAYTSPDVDQSAAETYGLQVVKDAAVMADRFFKKVEAREAEIRAKLFPTRVPSL